jgi:rhamnulokinase
MNKQIINLAFDFGASSGRLMMSRFDGKTIKIEEIYRFENEPVRIGKRLYWDILRLFHEMKNGLKKAASMNLEISSIGIDTWGIDYGLLDKNDNLLSNPLHYRDNRTENVLEHIDNIVTFEEIYKSTGIQYLNFNTIYQLISDKEIRGDLLKEAKSLLLITDLLNFFLTGKRYNEYTNASTTQMVNANDKQWDYKLLEKLDIPHSLLQKIIMPGNIIGYLTEEIQEEIGIGAIPVVAVGSHDTASAVAGTPLIDQNSAYLICGTWCLLGMETNKPIINENSLKYNFTNEGGVDNTIRFLKNINGLWLIQQLRKSWSDYVHPVSFSEIIEASMNVEKKHYVVDPNNEKFMAPLNMVEAIKEYCIEKGQGTPENLGEIAIAAYNGLTEEYKSVVDSLEKTIGKTIDTINMVGGGIQDRLLCTLTAQVTGKKVIAGPIEASALGNVIMQLKALGELKNLEEGRKIIRKSFSYETFMP